ncbi:hypothetical protein D1007_28729 [Hordeum vulgare]|nr:hypothetical protein D1007_28729 [Hordeum vulgare]
MGGVGHWVSVFLELKNEWFQLLDYHYGPTDESAVCLFQKRTNNIKKLWSDASNDRETPLNPLSIDHFPLDWIDVPQEHNNIDCGFLMLTNVISFHHGDLANYTHKDIFDIRKTWLMRKCGKSVGATVAGRGGKNGIIARRKPTLECGKITSSKTTARLPLKWRSLVCPLKKYMFLYLHEARKLKGFVLSEDGLKKHMETSYCMFTLPGDVSFAAFLYCVDYDVLSPPMPKFNAKKLAELWMRLFARKGEDLLKAKLFKRFVGFLEEVYGKAEYKTSKQPNSLSIAKRPTYVKVAKQGANECGFFRVKFCFTYDGDGLTEDFGDLDCPGVDDWEAEFMYTLVFTPKNEIMREELPAEIRELEQ